MDSSIKKQIRSGFRLGASAGGFLIAAMLIGNGGDRIIASTASHQIAWIGWAELVIAAAILLLTAHVWLLLLGGYMLFGVIKGLFLFATGSFPSHGFSTRLEPLGIAVYGVATLALLYRFAQSPPTVLDRVALTIFLFCFVIPWIGPSSALSWSQMIGLAVLLASWGISRWRPPRDGECSAHGVKAQ
jgi:hypothetical protein